VVPMTVAIGSGRLVIEVFTVDIADVIVSYTEFDALVSDSGLRLQLERAESDSASASF